MNTVTSHNQDNNLAINATAFALYLKDELKMADATCMSYASTINNCEVFAREHGLSSWKLYTNDRSVAQATISLLLKDDDFIDYNMKRHSRLSAALSKFLQFLEAKPIITSSKDEKQIPESFIKRNEYASVLKEKFAKGFHMESSLEIRKFRRYYSIINEIELEDSDDLISQNIRKMCLLYDGKAYLPDSMLNEDLKTSLIRFIDESFASGKPAIYYQALYEKFSIELLDYPIQNANMLREYLKHLGMNKLFFNNKFMAQTADVIIDPITEIRECLKEHARPMKYDELFSKLPHLPPNNIKSILKHNEEFVNNSPETYFHESAVCLSEEELKNISDIITYLIEDSDFVPGNELYDAIKNKYPYIIENYAFCSVKGFRDALKNKLRQQFSFKGNIISRAGQELSIADVFANFAKKHDSFTLTDIQSLASDLTSYSDTAYASYIDSIYKSSMRVSKELFVSKSHAQFAIAETDAVLDRFCTGNYISIQEITNFSIFPYAGFPWNSFLLEQFVAEYSKKYTLLHTGCNCTKCAGAIVKRKSGIQNFDDFIVDFLAKSNIELNKASALQLLSDEGYIALRRYSKIESLIIQAMALRNRKNTD